MLLLVLVLDAGATDLTLDGACPGPVLFEVTDMTPGGRVAVLAGSGPGAAPIPGGPCRDVSSGLAGPLRFFGPLADIDVDGVLAFRPDVPLGLCSRSLVAVDLETCEVSAPVEFGAEPGAVMRWEDATTGSCPSDIHVRFGEIAAAMPDGPIDVTITAHQIDPAAGYGDWEATFVDTDCVKRWLETIAARDVSTYDDWAPAVCNATTDAGESFYFVCKNDGALNPQIAIYPTTAAPADFMKVYMLDRTFAWCDLAGVDNRPGFDAEVTNGNTFGNAGDYVEFAW
ncbi:MAG: hypothetical protein ACI8PZ_004672 [Myxococcota bacterium]|jgi:hypothetical protein